MTSLRRLFRFVLVTAATLPMPAIGGQQSLGNPRMVRCLSYWPWLIARR